MIIQRIQRVVDEIRLDGSDGAAAVLTEAGTEDWVQFGLIPDRGLHFDFPHKMVSATGIEALGPWEQVTEIPLLDDGDEEIGFSFLQLEAVRGVLKSRQIDSYFHAQAVFDSSRAPIATSTSFQFDVPLGEPRIAELVVELFEAAYSYRPIDLEVKRLIIEWD